MHDFRHDHTHHHTDHLTSSSDAVAGPWGRRRTSTAPSREFSMKPRRTTVLSAVASGMLASTLAMAPATAAPQAAMSARISNSDIALKAGAYGTRMAGGQVPAGSGMTAFSVIACSTKPGVDHHNEVADADLPSVGTASGVKTKVWTRNRNGVLHSFSRSSTARVVLADSPLGSLSIDAVTSLSHAWHDTEGFHSETSSSVGKIVFTPPVGDPQEIDIPTPGSPVTVPGLATISLGESHEHASKTGSSAWAVALRVKVMESGTDLLVSRSKAVAVPGVEHGRFGGYSAGTEAEALGGVLTGGRNPLSIMPCQGTDGKVVGRTDANLDLEGDAEAAAASSRQFGKRYADHSLAWERGSVTGIDFGGGALLIDSVVGKATVVRKAGGGLVRSTDGTRIGTITADGEPQDVPVDETIEIPGVARLEPKVVEKLAGGLKVIALRVTLLDGSGAVVDLGVAKTTLRN
jgi:hypothetical protein